MIHMPQRSVTRFFIPLVDVLMLLFSMFLLMPLVAGRSDPNGKSAEAMTPEELRQKNKQLKADLDLAMKQVKVLNYQLAQLYKYADPQKSLEKLQQELELLQKAKGEMLQKRLFMQVVAYDPVHQGLVYHQAVPKGKTQAISNAGDVSRLVDQHGKEARALGLEPYYILMMPPDGTAASASQGQIAEFEKWFTEQTVPFKTLFLPAASSGASK